MPCAADMFCGLQSTGLAQRKNRGHPCVSSMALMKKITTVPGASLFRKGKPAAVVDTIQAEKVANMVVRFVEKSELQRRSQGWSKIPLLDPPLVVRVSESTNHATTATAVIGQRDVKRASSQQRRKRALERDSREQQEQLLQIATSEAEKVNKRQQTTTTNTRRR